MIRVSTATVASPPGARMPPAPAYRSSVFSRMKTMSTSSGRQTWVRRPEIECLIPSSSLTGRMLAYRSSPIRLPTMADQPAILPSGRSAVLRPSGAGQPIAPSRIASASMQRCCASSGQSRPCSRKYWAPPGISSKSRPRRQTSAAAPRTRRVCAMTSTPTPSPGSRPSRYRRSSALAVAAVISGLRSGRVRGRCPRAGRTPGTPVACRAARRPARAGGSTRSRR